MDDPNAAIELCFYVFLLTFSALILVHIFEYVFEKWK